MPLVYLFENTARAFRDGVRLERVCRIKAIKGNIVQCTGREQARSGRS